MKNMVLLRKEADTHLSINSLKKKTFITESMSNYKDFLV